MQPRACPGQVVMSLVPVADFYAEAIWYSRYDNMIGFARVRPGLRLMESDHFAVEAYALAAINFDGAGRQDNRFTEGGVGLAFKINAPLRVNLRVEAVHVSRQDQAALFDRRVRIEQEYRF